MGELYTVRYIPMGGGLQPPNDQTDPPHDGPSYPAPGDQGYPHPAPRGVAGDPQPSGYSPPGKYSPATGSHMPLGNFPPPTGPTTIYQPSAIAGYPLPGSGYPSPNNQAVTPGNRMPPPMGVLMCPPGLEYLSVIDQILVRQEVELLNAFFPCVTKKEYCIMNSFGQKIYTAKEDTDCCTRYFCFTLHPFDIRIRDNAGNEVIHMNRSYCCESCCCPCCCLQRLEVCAPPGTVVGYVVEEVSFARPIFHIENAAGETVLRIEGPICTSSCCGDIKFKVLSVDRSVEVGKITKQWSGLLREAFTDCDHFGITFPVNFDVGMKAVLLGACFLIDFIYFQT